MGRWPWVSVPSHALTCGNSRRTRGFPLCHTCPTQSKAPWLPVSSPAGITGLHLPSALGHADAAVVAETAEETIEHTLARMFLQLGPPPRSHRAGLQPGRRQRRRQAAVSVEDGNIPAPPPQGDPVVAAGLEIAMKWGAALGGPEHLKVALQALEPQLKREHQLRLKQLEIQRETPEGKLGRQGNGVSTSFV